MLKKFCFLLFPISFSISLHNGSNASMELEFKESTKITHCIVGLEKKKEQMISDEGDESVIWNMIVWYEMW